jgi:Skp family chaperone for outer membrane proteins
MNPKLSKLMLPTIAIGALMTSTFHSIAMANPGGCYESMQTSSEDMHKRMQAKLDKLAARLEITSSQQPVWEEFAKSVESRAGLDIKKPGEDADAATISRFRAERANEFSKKLARIADATAKLQTALDENQRKILNQVSHRFLHAGHHGLNREQNGMDENHSFRH